MTNFILLYVATQKKGFFYRQLLRISNFWFLLTLYSYSFRKFALTFYQLVFQFHHFIGYCMNHTSPTSKHLLCCQIYCQRQGVQKWNIAGKWVHYAAILINIIIAVKISNFLNQGSKSKFFELYHLLRAVKVKKLITIFVIIISLQQEWFQRRV